ncbi:MAG TPA: ATP-binding cassette domain-containing protein [Pseudobdellovibrionaceae bacterium]|nr:ATP-binding cassette domain-containing protein [Pseudobdellovibrionaceae bacterium]
MTNGTEDSQAVRLRISNFQLRRPDGRGMFDELSASLGAGELMVIQGPNGVGKSSLLRAILGLWPHSSGKIDLRVSFDNDEIAYLPQQGQLQFFLPLTLGEVVELGAGSPRQTKEILAADFWDVQWDSASGGERQKALLTRIFRSPAALLILDEPFNHLDHESARALWGEMIASLQRGASVLLVAHGEEQRIPNELREKFPVKLLRLQGLQGRNAAAASLRIAEAPADEQVIDPHSRGASHE